MTFEAAIKAGAPVIMTGHVAVDAIEPGMPASISAGVVQGLLRDTLGFQGVAVTDSQGMGPINGPYNSAEGAVRSLLAGNDLVLNSPYPRKARRAVQQAVATGRLPGRAARRGRGAGAGAAGLPAAHLLSRLTRPVPRGTRSTSSRCLADMPSPLETPRSRRPTHGAR